MSYKSSFEDTHKMCLFNRENLAFNVEISCRIRKVQITKAPSMPFILSVFTTHFSVLNSSSLETSERDGISLPNGLLLFNIQFSCFLVQTGGRIWSVEIDCVFRTFVQGLHYCFRQHLREYLEEVLQFHIQ